MDIYIYGYVWIYIGNIGVYKPNVYGYLWHMALCRLCDTKSKTSATGKKKSRPELIELAGFQEREA